MIFDSSELHKLVADLGDMPRRVQAQSVPIIRRAGLQMKEDWAARWTGISGMPHLAGSISYDVEIGLRGVEVEVGPDPERTQGPLDNIAEFGSSQHPPIRPVSNEVLEREAQNLERVVGAMVKPL